MSIGESYLSKHHRSFIHCKLPWRRICITVAPNGVSIHVTHVNFAKFECCTKYFSIIKSRYEKRQNRSQICHEIKSPYFGEPGHTLTFQFCTLFREENTDWKLICWDNHPPTQLLSSVILRILFRTYAREMCYMAVPPENTHFRCLCTGSGNTYPCGRWCQCTYPILSEEKNWLENTDVLLNPDMRKDKIDPRSVMK